LLAAEVRVEGARRDAGLGGDVRQSRPDVAVAREDDLRRVDEGLPGALATLAGGQLLRGGRVSQQRLLQVPTVADALRIFHDSPDRGSDRSTLTDVLERHYIPN